MKDQTDKIQKELATSIQSEVLRLEKEGLTRGKIAEQAGVQLPLLSNFMRSNDEHTSIAIPRLIRIASGLDLKIELTIQKKEGGA